MSYQLMYTGTANNDEVAVVLQPVPNATTDTMSNILSLSNSGYVTIGTGSTGEASPDLLVLDNESSSGTGDPTGVSGSMYYSQITGSFRCDIGGSWTNCVNGAAYEASTVSGAIPAATAAKGAAATILFAPLYLPGPTTVNTMMVDITTATGAGGDIGIYNSSGSLVLDGGTSSIASGASGMKSITPTQTGTARNLSAGQYYMAVTWNSTTGIIAGANFGSTTIAGFYPRAGHIATGGGTSLPSSVTLTSITQDQYLYSFTVHN
jgi:hypothetical protein